MRGRSPARRPSVGPASRGRWRGRWGLAPPPGLRPWGSRFGDVTSGRIAPGGLARIECRRIPSRWARITQVRPAPAGFVRSLLGSASTSLNPRDRTSGRRARGLSDDLGDYPTISRTRAATGREPHGNCHHTKRRPRGGITAENSDPAASSVRPAAPGTAAEPARPTAPGDPPVKRWPARAFTVPAP